MTEPQATHPDQLRSDLQFLRHVVEHRRFDAPAAILWIWAAYVLVGYPLLDYDPRVGGMVLMIAGPVCGIASWLIGARAAKRLGEIDRQAGRIEALHWLAVLLGVLALVALAVLHPQLRSSLGGQLIVICIGIVYYLYGVHRDAAFVWLGLLLLAGGVGVSFIPVYPWTCLGIVIALGLVVPTLFRRRAHVSQD